MTGRERLQAALGEGGAPEIPVVICYESIYLRDRWHELSSRPWWYRQAPDLDRQLAWRREVIERLGQDWYQLPRCRPRGERQRMWIDQRHGRVYLVDRDAGTEEELLEPPVGGWWRDGGLQSARTADPPQTREQVEAQLAPPAKAASGTFSGVGSADLAARMLSEHAGLLPYASVTSPLWNCHGLWGFEGFMTRVATDPELVRYACERHVEGALESIEESAALGAAAVWIEECLTDMLSPGAFARINLPAVRAIVDAIRAAGMRSVYYYCGDPAGKWDLLLEAGADALSLEESKKGFTIDIDDVVERVAGRCTVFGNLDAVSVLQDGSDEQLRAAIERQIAAGRRNGSRFVMSLGSPGTPDTPLARVRRYCDLARELGST